MRTTILVSALLLPLLLLALTPPSQPALNSATIAQQLAAAQIVTLQPGRYTIDVPLPPLKRNQVLRGAGAGLTELFVTYTAPTDPFAAVVYLDHGSQVTDLTISHAGINPNVVPTVADATRHPWDIWVGYCVEDWRIERVRLANGPKGIMCYGTHGTIRDVTMGCWYRGLIVDTCGHTINLDSISINEPLPDASGNIESSPFIQWQRNNSIAFWFRRVDGLRARNLFAARHKYGILCSGSESPYEPEFWHGTRPGGYIDGGGLECKVCVKLDWSIPVPAWDWSGDVGITMNQFYFSPDADGRVIEMNGDEEPILHLANSVTAALPANLPNEAYIKVSQGKLSMNLIRLENKFDRQLFLQIDQGTLDMTGGSIGGVAGQNAVKIGPNARRVVIAGVHGLAGTNRVTGLGPNKILGASTEP